MPPDDTKTSSRPRSANIFLSRASAMMLRLTLAWQTIRMRRRETVSSETLGEDVVHGLLAGRALRELRLEGLAELRGIPLAALLRLADRVPALHQPHGAAADAEDLAVDVRRVVAREPGDERRNVRRTEHVELSRRNLLAHERRRRRRRLDREARTRDRGNRIHRDAVLRHLLVDDH